jgi:hypothetical protein
MTALVAIVVPCVTDSTVVSSSRVPRRRTASSAASCGAPGRDGTFATRTSPVA